MRFRDALQRGGISEQWVWGEVERSFQAASNPGKAETTPAHRVTMAVSFPVGVSCCFVMSDSRGRGPETP